MKVQISIPTSTKEITLEQYQRFVSLSKLDDDILKRKMLDIFCGVKDILKVKATDVNKVTSKLNQVLQEPVSFQETFTLDGKPFGFIPSLEDITFGELVDLDNLLKWDTMHMAMSILFRPITNKVGARYEIEEYESSTKYSELMKKAPLSVVFGAMVFFWTLSSDLLTDSLVSLASKKKEQTNTQQEASTQQNMDGLQQYIHLAGEILQNKKRLKSSQQADAFIHLATLQTQIK